MRWIGRRQSDNVEDRRGMSPKTMVGGGLGTLIIVIIVLLLGGNPLELLQNMPEAETGMVPQSTSQEDNELAQFAKVVMADTEDIWGKLFQQAGSQYQPPVLVLYTDMVQSACGYGSAATGPFYCPGDSKVYIDLSFYRDLQTRFQAPGDFAMAYVIAHEVGHHIQNLTGVNDKVMAIRERADQRTYNKYSVAMELQADFYSGIWAHYDQKLNNVLEEGDLEEALNAASAVGDDRIQKRTRGTVVPDAFTHGTSEQRRMWFERGFKTGDLSQGDTFTAYGLEF